VKHVDDQNRVPTTLGFIWVPLPLAIRHLGHSQHPARLFVPNCGKWSHHGRRDPDPAADRSSARSFHSMARPTVSHEEPAQASRTVEPSDLVGCATRFRRSPRWQKKLPTEFAPLRLQPPILASDVFWPYRRACLAGSELKFSDRSDFMSYSCMTA
jgi:hypothetical protein